MEDVLASSVAGRSSAMASKPGEKGEDRRPGCAGQPAPPLDQGWQRESHLAAASIGVGQGKVVLYASCQLERRIQR